jgi:hypothetical protein
MSPAKSISCRETIIRQTTFFLNHTQTQNLGHYDLPELPIFSLNITQTCCHLVTLDSIACSDTAQIALAFAFTIDQIETCICDIYPQRNGVTCKSIRNLQNISQSPNIFSIRTNQSASAYSFRNESSFFCLMQRETTI